MEVSVSKKQYISIIALNINNLGHKVDIEFSANTLSNLVGKSYYLSWFGSSVVYYYQRLPIVYADVADAFAFESALFDKVCCRDFY